MIQRWIVVCALLLILLVTRPAAAKRPAPTPTPAAALADYVAAPDDSYSWKLRRKGYR